MTQDSKMSEYLSEIKNVLTLMQQEREFSKKEREHQREQLEAYRETVDKSLRFQEKEIKRMEIQQEKYDKKAHDLRVFARWAVGFAIGFILTGSVSIATKPSMEDVKDLLKDEDYVSKIEVLRSHNSIIDDTFDVLERHTDMTHDESRQSKLDAKINAGKEITGYVSRSPKKVK